MADKRENTGDRPNNNTKHPLVSVCVITYQHASYIRDCLNGILMQKTSFDFEIIINDDASTDGTSDIIREYESRFPEIIVPVYHEENEYSRGLKGINARNTFPIARGKYIALCDGDDYWTDPFKLEKQVDFLETHKDYIIVCGGYRSVGPDGENENIVSSIVPSNQEDDNGFSFTLHNFSYTWFTKTLTTLFRNKAGLSNYVEKYKFARDIHLFHYLLKQGKGYYIKQVLGVYNKHEGGISSLKSRTVQLVIHYYMYKDMYEISPDEFTRIRYLTVCQDLLNLKVSLMMNDRKIKVRSLLSVVLCLTKTRSELIYFIKSLIPSQVKSVVRASNREYGEGL